jgi:DNA-binding HxlR family transcriptional regulator
MSTQRGLDWVPSMYAVSKSRLLDVVTQGVIRQRMKVLVRYGLVGFAVRKDGRFVHTYYWTTSKGVEVLKSGESITLKLKC